MDFYPQTTDGESREKMEAGRLANTVLLSFEIAEKIDIEDITPQARHVQITVERNILDTIDPYQFDDFTMTNIVADPQVYITLTYKNESLQCRPSLSVQFMRDNGHTSEHVCEVYRSGGDTCSTNDFSGIGVSFDNETIAILLQSLVQPRENLLVNEEGVTDVAIANPTVIADPQFIPTAHFVEDTLKEKGCPYIQVEEYRLDDVDGSSYVVRIEKECNDDGERTTGVTILEDNRTYEVTHGVPIAHGALQGSQIQASSWEHSIQPLQENSFGDRTSLPKDEMCHSNLRRMLSNLAIHLGVTQL